jgi:hypothetical protein
VWNCLQTASGQDCGRHALGKSAAPQIALGIALSPNRELGYDGTYSAGPLTASPPAFP